MSNKVIQAMYDDDDVLIKAVKETRAAHHHIEEVYTPFPVHGLDRAMGLEDTRIAITAFMYGLVGLSFAVWMLNYMMIQDWPQNIGGKPSFSFHENMPAFVPIMFEITILTGAVLSVVMMISILFKFPNNSHPLHDSGYMKEVSSDKYGIYVEAKDAKFDYAKLEKQFN